METKLKDAIVQVRVPQADKDDLSKIAEQLGVSESFVMRAAFRRTVQDLKQQIKEGKGVRIELCP